MGLEDPGDSWVDWKLRLWTHNTDEDKVTGFQIETPNSGKDYDISMIQMIFSGDEEPKGWLADSDPAQLPAVYADFLGWVDTDKLREFAKAILALVPED